MTDLENNSHTPTDAQGERKMQQSGPSGESASSASHLQASDPPRALSALPTGARGVIHSLSGGHSFGSRVANLGFTVGAAVSVRQNYGHGPMIVALRGTLVALGRAEAAKVLVRMES